MKKTPRLFCSGSIKLGLILLCILLSNILWAQNQKKEIKLGTSCITAECHANLKQPKFLHGPLNQNQCEPCHVTVGNRHEFKKPAEGRALCLICHEAEPPKKVVHSPFAVDCGMCHDPHGGDNRYFLIGGTGPESCERCHTSVRAGLAFLHGPVALGECLVCHSPHQSDNKYLLTDPPVQLCYNCHTDFQAKMEGAVSVHEPVKTDCSGCHGAHGGANQLLLVAQGTELCKKCHEDFLKKIAEYKYSHIAMTEEKSCEKCHQAHSSKQAGLLIANTEDLCLACHNKTVQTKKRTLSNIEAQITGSKYLHGPIRQKNCIACHQPHGSSFPNILNKSFPADFYASFTENEYDLCFECHDKKLVMTERSTDTGFRNGDLSLHYLHVHREKGRSCRACHAEHASNQPNHIRSEVPFGRWIMRLVFTKTETGGGCTTGCHLPYKYDRQNPVDNKIQVTKP